MKLKQSSKMLSEILAYSNRVKRLQKIERRRSLKGKDTTKLIKRINCNITYVMRLKQQFKIDINTQII